MAFNKDIITGLLGDKYNFDGVVCADWGIITDRTMGNGYVWPGRAWGVESLVKALSAPTPSAHQLTKQSANGRTGGAAPPSAYAVTKKRAGDTNSIIIWRVDPTRNDPRLRKHYGKTSILPQDREGPGCRPVERIHSRRFSAKWATRWGKCARTTSIAENTVTASRTVNDGF
jgi:hypothetical protein